MYNSAVGIYMDIMKPKVNTDRTNNHDITKLEDRESAFVCVRSRVCERERERHRQTERQRETERQFCLHVLAGRARVCKNQIIIILYSKKSTVTVNI